MLTSVQELVLSPPFSQEVSHWLGSMAYCSGYFSTHTFDCSDCSDSDYYATLDLDFDSDNCLPHTVLAAVIDSD